MSAPGRILVCIDGSAASLAAAGAAARLAVRTGWRLVGLAVLDQPGARGQAPHHRSELDARAALERAERIAAGTGVEMEMLIRRGSTVEQVLAVAADLDVEMIAMGRTGRNRPGTAAMGSSAFQVAEFTDRPLLLVPAAPRSR